MQIAFLEPEARHYTRLIQATSKPLLSAANLLEASILIESRLGIAKRDLFESFVDDSGIGIEPVTRAQVLIARDAYLRFGKGHHAAGLNFGDCFAYALAKERSAAAVQRRRLRPDRYSPGAVTGRAWARAILRWRTPHKWLFRIARSS